MKATAKHLGLTFATALRAILRQDFNVVMVGEIRDAETAENAVRAALTGRMVLSTLHTNTPEAAVDRLKDLGVPGYLIEATLRGTLGQRLAGVCDTQCIKATLVESYTPSFESPQYLPPG